MTKATSKKPDLTCSRCGKPIAGTQAYIFDDESIHETCARERQAERNPSGIRPVEYRILVKPTEVEERTEGGIIIPPTVRDRDQMAQADGVLMAVGGSAFSDWKAPGDAPSIGDRLTFAKYAGIVLRGQDGEEYRLLEDKEVFGVLT